MSDSKVEKKKSHKRNRGEVEGSSVDNVICIPVSEDEEINEAEQKRKEEKRLKKLKKKEKAALENSSEPMVEIEEPKIEEVIDSKKKKKNKKKPSNSSVEVESTETKEPAESNKLKQNTKFNAPHGNYIEHSATSSMTASDILSFRTDANLTVYPEEESQNYKPITKFEYLYPSISEHCPSVVAYLEAKKFPAPSPIQSQCWPTLLQGRDIVGIASTGSGKTLAFLIPALLKIAKLGPMVRQRDNIPRPRVLVMAPTRELALQSHNVVLEIGATRGVCIFGGVPKGVQKGDLQAGADVVVATPGRLLDLVEEGVLSLSEVCFAVLDEADRMLDDGFEPAIRKILSMCPPAASGTGNANKPARQTAMFSATWPEEIRALADTFLSPNTVRVIVGSTELSANHRVTQLVDVIGENNSREKDRRLLQLLEKYHNSKGRKNRILIFVLYKREAVTLLNTLQAKGYHAGAIHGDMGQYDRLASLDAFKAGTTPLLIATDVAARGLDIPQVEYVLNYSFPLTVEDYVHRIGRTGRGGASGISHTFFSDFDKGLAGALVAVLQEAGQEVPPEIYRYQMVTKKKASKLYGDFGPNKELQGKKSTKIVFD